MVAGAASSAPLSITDDCSSGLGLGPGPGLPMHIAGSVSFAIRGSWWHYLSWCSRGFVGTGG